MEGLEPNEDKITLPEQLQGKTIEEVYKALQQEYDSITKLHEAEKAKLNAEKSALENAVKTIQKPVMPPTQRVEESLWSGPEDIVSKVREEMTAPLAAIANNLRATNRNTFVMQLQQSGKTDDWGKYGAEIEQVVNALHPTAQGQPEAYVAAYSYVRGIHVDDIVREQREAVTEETVKTVLSKLGMDNRVSDVIRNETSNQNLFQRQLGVPHMGASRVVDLNRLSSNAPTLTAEQANIAKRYNMTAEEYIKYMKE